MGEKTLGQIAHDAWHSGPFGQSENRPSLWDQRAPEYQIAWDFAARAVRAHVLEEAAQAADAEARSADLASVNLNDEETVAHCGIRAKTAIRIADAIRALAKDGAE